MKGLMVEIEYRAAELEEYLIFIDENNIYRTKIKDFDHYIKDGQQLIPDEMKHKSSHHRSMLIPELEEDDILKKLLTQYKENDKSIILSAKNKYNIILSLFHTFFFYFMCTIVQPSNADYLTKLGVDPIYTGLIMGLTPLSAIISAVLFNKWSETCFKKPMIASCILFLLGSLLYSYAFDAQSVTMLAVGRLFIGMGSARSLNRKYLIQYVDKTYLADYGIFYVRAGMVGLAMGPGISRLLMFIDDFSLLNISFNKVTSPGWLSFFISLILLILIIVLYSEPHDLEFKIHSRSKLY
jgi:hypothetical protein